MSLLVNAMDRLVALIIDESKWLPASMALAFIAIVILIYRKRNSHLPVRLRMLSVMNLFFGVTILTMAFGHLLAVTSKLAIGSLQGSPLKLYAIGVALIVPSFLLVAHTRQILLPHKDQGGRTILFNGWLAATLLVLGIHNLPLAAPAFINIGYHLHSRRVVGWALLSIAILITVALFVGSVIFFLSGQSFEQFSGME
jgi:hypothetical protein